jgi:hypothetical protein
MSFDFQCSQTEYTEELAHIIGSVPDKKIKDYTEEVVFYV